MKGFYSGVILLIIFSMMYSAQTLYIANEKDNISINIYNFTENHFVWNYTFEEDTIQNNFTNRTGLNYGTIQVHRITNLIRKFIDWAGYSIFEISKWVFEFGYTHPEYDFNYFMTLIKFWLFAMIIIALFPILIPLMALFYLIIITIKKKVAYLISMLPKLF